MNKKGFTLIELLIGISISTILMISVGFLISGGIKNITNQEKILQNSGNFSSFNNELINIFNNIDTNFEPKITASGVIVKIKQEYDKGGFAYIGESTSELPSSGKNIYCDPGSEDIQTKHIFIKTFIPDFDIDTQKSHKISGVGKGFFGSPHLASPEGEEQSKVYLNNPTGKVSSGSIDFISDTLNNRILYKSGSKVYELLNREDGLSEPTDLKIISGDLYIANSGNGEILKYSSKALSNQSLTLTGITTNNINKFKISFYDNDGNKNINNSITKNDFSFTNYTKQSGDSVSVNNNKLTYSFSGGINKNLSNEKIIISNLVDFSGTGTYFIKLDINNKYYKYITQGDDNLLTKNDNTLEIYKKNLKYPTKINSLSNITEYWNGSKSNMSYEKEYDYILKNPINNLNINWNNSDKLLNLNLNYYNKYNCYNLNEKSSREIILKKNYK